MYLQQVNPEETFEENLKRAFLKNTSYLYEEPLLLLRQEVQEPGVYSAIIEAIAGGYTKANEIATKIGEEPAKCLKYMKTLCESEGSVTIIGAVSPQGSDFSEPVTQNTKRFTRCFWALDKALAYARHYPSVNWNNSYSEYISELDNWYEENVDSDFPRYRDEIASILYKESSLMEIVKLIGADVLPDDQKLTLEIARVIREGFLQQNAFHKYDTYVPLSKQHKMMKIILHLYHKCQRIIALQIPVSRLTATGLFEKIIKIKYDVANDETEKLDSYITMIDKALSEYIR